MNSPGGFSLTGANIRQTNDVMGRMAGVALPSMRMPGTGGTCGLGHEHRERIFGIILDDPGINFTSIMRALDVRNGVVSHHLSMLERGDLISSRRDGIYTRYYPKNRGLDIPKELHDRIFDIVLFTPGINQSQIARRLRRTRQVINYHVRQMVSKGLLRTSRMGRECRCFITNWTF